MSDGTKLKDMTGNCRILPRSSEQGSEVTVGTMQYIPVYKDKDPVYNHSHPSHFHVELYIPENQFNDITNNLRCGKLPSGFEIRVRGMSLPTEFEYAWDVEKTPKLPIVYFWASFVAAVDYSISKESEPFKQTQEPSYYPISRADFVTLLQMIKVQSEQIEKLAEKMAWIAGGVMLIAVILAWRMFFH